MIILAPFYKDIENDKEGSEVLEMSKVFDYKQNLFNMYNTFLKQNSKHKFEICTDNKTSLKHKNIFRSNIDSKNLMESFCISNLDFVKSRNEKLILCGSDHLINGNLNSLFEDDFDIGLAVATKPLRINNTIVLVNDTNRKKVISFFEQRLSAYYNLSAEEKLWFGDQLSYQKILESYNIFDPSGDNPPLGIYNIEGLKIKLFAYGSSYVAALKKSLYPVPNNPVIIDFKGPKRKKRAPEIYRYLMNDV